MSAMSPSSGFGSAMSTWIVVSTVERFTAARPPSARDQDGAIGAGRARVRAAAGCGTWLPVALWRHVERVEADAPAAVDVRMIDWCCKSDLCP